MNRFSQYKWRYQWKLKVLNDSQPYLTESSHYSLIFWFIISEHRRGGTHCQQVHDGVTRLSEQWFSEANAEQRTGINCKTKGRFIEKSGATDMFECSFIISIVYFSRTEPSLNSLTLFYPHLIYELIVPALVLRLFCSVSRICDIYESHKLLLAEFFPIFIIHKCKWTEQETPHTDIKYSEVCLQLGGTLLIHKWKIRLLFSPATKAP